MFGRGPDNGFAAPAQKNSSSKTYVRRAVRNMACKIATFALYGLHLQAALRNAMAHPSPRCYHSHQAARLALWQTSTRQDRQHPCAYLRLGVVAAIAAWSHAVRHPLGRLCRRRATAPPRAFVPDDYSHCNGAHVAPLAELPPARCRAQHAADGHWLVAHDYTRHSYSARSSRTVLIFNRSHHLLSN